MHKTSITHKTTAALIVAAILLAPAAGYAQTCGAETEARLQFLETRLDEGQRNMLWWYRSWLTVFTIGFVYSVASGATEDDGSNQAADFIQAGKSMLGVIDLRVRPHIARHGAEPIRAIAKSSDAACAQRLALAESTMEKAAEEGSVRWSWKRHLWSLMLNLGAGLAVAEGWDDEGTGWRDFGVSEASAELHIWTHPTRARYDWADYRTEFDHAPAAAAPSTLRFAAQRGGLGLVWKF